MHYLPFCARFLFILISMTLTASCGTIYIHDPALKARADIAAAAFEAADFNAPFTERAARLDAVALRENRATVQKMVSDRNLVLADILGESDVERRRWLAEEIKDRLEVLVGEDRLAQSGTNRIKFLDAIQSAPNTHGGLVKRMREARLGVDAAQEALREVGGEFSCKKLPDGVSAETAAGRLRANCERLEKNRGDEEAIYASFGTNAAIGVLVNSITEQRAALEASTSIVAAIDEKLKESPGASGSLTQLRTDIAEILEGAKVGTEVLGWHHISTRLNALLRGDICSQSEEDVGKDVWAEADCASIGTASFENKTAATWRLVGALAGLADATNKNRRAPLALAAAKAISGAKLADARLRLEQEKSVLAANERRLAVLVSEASTLACASLALIGGERKGYCRGRGTSFAFVQLVDSWDTGRIPAAILEFLPIQLERMTALKRGHAASAEQAVLMQAAANQLKLYGAGGIEAESIADFLFNAGLIATVGAD